MKKAVRKSTLLVILGFIAIGFVACDKEGVYNPKKKISKITYEYASGSGIGDEEMVYVEREEEVWKWDKNKLVRIEAPEAGYNLDFKYDGKQVSEISDGTDKAVFTYDKSKLEKITLTEEGNSFMNIVVKEREGKKIKKIAYEYTGYALDLFKKPDLKSSRRPTGKMSAIMRFVLPDAVIRSLEKKAAVTTKNSSNVWIYEVVFIYNGDNVSRIKVIENSDVEVYAYTYDSKKNPFYDALWQLTLESYSAFSENNIASVTYNEDYPENKIQYTYKYDGNWPKERIYEESWQNGEFNAYLRETVFFQYE